MDGTFVPLSASIIQHQDQLFVSLYEDNCPSLSILNHTDFQFHVAQAATMNQSKTPVAISDCGPEDRFAWHQIVPAHQMVYYTPPVIDDTFPEIVNVSECGLTFACVGSNIRWSRPIKVQESKDLFLEVPLYGDVKVSVNATGKITRVVLDYIRQDSEFSAKDIRNRLSYPLLVASSVKKNDATMNDTQRNQPDVTVTQKKGFDGIIHAVMEGVRITLYTDCDKTNYERHGMLMLDFNQLSISSFGKKISVAFNSFQADNSLVSTGEFDFPVILCPQIECPEDFRTATVHELDTWFRVPRETFCAINVDLYEAESGCKSVEVKVKAIRAFIEDTYITILVEYLNDCFGTNALYEVEPEMERETCDAGEV